MSVWHLDVERELRGQDLEGQQAGFDEWRKTFNQERPHEALGMKCPAELYKARSANTKGRLKTWSIKGWSRGK